MSLRRSTHQYHRPLCGIQHGHNKEGKGASHLGLAVAVGDSVRVALHVGGRGGDGDDVGVGKRGEVADVLPTVLSIQPLAPSCTTNSATNRQDDAPEAPVCKIIGTRRHTATSLGISGGQ